MEDEKEQIQKMLSIIYQIPMGLIETDIDGKTLQMNAKSIQLLMPFFYKHKLKGDNIFELLKIVSPDLIQQILNFHQQSGCIINQERQELFFSDKDPGRQIVFTVNRLDASNLIFIFDDITELYNKEKEISQALQDKAIEQSKFEIASGVLHDIGNAVVGFGSYLTKIKQSIQQNDICTLDNLKKFIEKNKLSLETSLGEKKTTAIVDLLNGLIINQNEHLSSIRSSISDQMKIISHIQEILNIQRQYVKGEASERAPVNLLSVINDSVSMLFGAIEKNNIIFNFDAPPSLPKIKGDRTKLIQVFLNLLKNSIDAFSSSAKATKEIKVSIVIEMYKIKICIADNGIGFDNDTGRKLFSRGYTTKEEGTGLGLANCKNIIEGHNGEISIESSGIGEGATSIVIFNT